MFKKKLVLELENLETRNLLSYAITDLGTLGGTSSQAYDLNDYGQVVGVSARSPGPSHAFLWQDGEMTDLGTIDGHTGSSVASGINNAGQVVGWSHPSNGSRFRSAFLWQNGEMTDLGTLGGNNSWANRINDAGQIVGTSHRSGFNLERGFLWQDGEMTDLGTHTGFGYSLGFGINNLGQAVGESIAEGSGINDARGFLWQDGGMIAEIGTFGGWGSRARGINDAGQTVGGASLIFHGPPLHAFLWQDGELFDLGTLPGDDNSDAYDINNAGQVVGVSYLNCVPSCRTGYHAFVYQDGAMIDLNGELPKGSGWHLQYATAINDLGQIVGWGLHDGRIRAYLLTPEGSAPGSAPGLGDPLLLLVSLSGGKTPGAYAVEAPAALAATLPAESSSNDRTPDPIWENGPDAEPRLGSNRGTLRGEVLARLDNLFATGNEELFAW